VSILRNVFWPAVTDGRELTRYVLSVSLLILAAEIASDVIAAWTPMFGLSGGAKEFICDGLVSIGVAWPIARAIGRAQLELFRAKREADRQGRTDSLTGLANRRAFCEAAARLDGVVLALAIADIDRFKRVNDRFGHAAGDEVIKSVGRLMEQELGHLGTVARVGGEEFAVVCAHARAAELRQRLMQFRARVAEEAVLVDGDRIFATVSVGFAARPNANFEALYAAADKALYVAKAAGRDRVVDFDQIADSPDLLRAG
jgi:diguanylate cyclase (GGDEF)-like protein